MSISFNQIPNQTRVPFTYVEFDGSRTSSTPVQDYRVLVIGQRQHLGPDFIPKATQEALIPIRVPSEAKAKEYFGAGSMLHLMLSRVFEGSPKTEAYAIALDLKQGVAAEAILKLQGKVEQSGELCFLIAGRRIKIPAQKEKTAQELALFLKEKINSKSDLPFYAKEPHSPHSPHSEGEQTQIRLVAKDLGSIGNELMLRLNPDENDKIPSGLKVDGEPFSGGAGTPCLMDAFKALKQTQYHILVNPYTDPENLETLEQELSYRFRPDRQIEGHAFSAIKQHFSDACQLGAQRNSPHVTLMMAHASPTPSWEWASSLAGVVSFYGNLDPARPFRTLELPSLLPPEETKRLAFEERENLLKEGISTYTVDSGGRVRIEKLISTYKWSDSGEPSESYSSVNTLLTLSRLRYDFRSYFGNKYPRHKLASDQARFGVGQAIMTPSLAKAECLALFRQWEEQGLVQNIDSFKKDLEVEINVQNPSRLDFLMSPKLVNQLCVLGVKVAFLF